MDLKLVKIADCKTDNERLIIRAVRACNLNEYIVFDTTFDEDGIVSNKHRHVFIMPNVSVNEGDFIWLYTRQGTYHTHNNKSNTITHNIYWGLNINVWNNDGDKAYLIHYDDWGSVVSKGEEQKKR